MRTLLIFVVYVLSGSYAWSQSTPVAAPPPVLPENPFLAKKFAQYVTTVDQNGRPFATNEEVRGYPYFVNGFRQSKVTLSGNRVYSGVDVLIDLEHQEIHVRYGGSKEMVVEDGLIKEISMIDTVSAKPAYYLFRTGYPAIDRNNEKTIYEVVVNGKLSLIRQVKKVLVKDKNPVSGEENNEYKEYATYYFFKEGNILPYTKDNLAVLTGDKEEKVAAYIKSEKINVKKISSVTELINYYNSL
jgi:hypothetical protein